MRLSVGKTFQPCLRPSDGFGWSRFYANAELAKDKRSLLSALGRGLFSRFLVLREGVAQQRLGFSISAGRSGIFEVEPLVEHCVGRKWADHSSGGKKSFNLSLGYGEIFKGRTVGAGSEWTTSVSMGF
jgi:hypothetical protein